MLMAKQLKTHEEGAREAALANRREQRMRNLSDEEKARLNGGNKKRKRGVLVIPNEATVPIPLVRAGGSTVSASSLSNASNLQHGAEGGDDDNSENGQQTLFMPV
jgi:hypothetical protein